MNGWANHTPGAPWGDSSAALARNVHGAATGVPRRPKMPSGARLCVCMGGTADCEPPFGSSGGCSLSHDEPTRERSS